MSNSTDPGARPASLQVARAARDARIALIDGSAGVRMLLATLVKSGYPNAVIKDIDPYAQTMRGAAFNVDTDGDVIILGGLGTLTEATDALTRLRTRTDCAPIIVLCESELSRQPKPLLAAGAFAVLRKDALSAARLHVAIDHALSACTAPDPATHAYGEFTFVQNGGTAVVEIDGFKCESGFSSGEHAQVFFAEQIATGKRVIIKILTAFQIHNLAAMRAVCARRRWLDHAHTPHMVSRLDTGIAGAFSYVVLEFLACGDLRQRMKTQLESSAILAVMAGLLDALANLHAGGLAHADLKPECIFFRETGTVVLIDFDIATPFGQAVVAVGGTGKPTALGTPNYSSPEQGAGLPVDATTDIYAAGIIFFEMLTGAVPFTGDSPAQIVFHHMHDEIPLLPLPLRHLQPLIDNMLAKNPAERYPSALAARRALQPFLAGFGDSVAL